MKQRIQHLTYFFILLVVLLAGCSGCGEKTSQETGVKSAGQFFDEFLSEQDHHHSLDVKIPLPPQSDIFFPTIVFPNTPPERVDGHYHPSKNPFPVPEFVTENPDRFVDDDEGFWNSADTPEINEKLEQLFDEGLSGDAYRKRYAEIVSEGLDTIPAAVAVLKAHIAKNEAKKLFEQVLSENPDDFHALRYWSAMIKHDNPQAAEKARRRIPELRPDSLDALYALGTHIVDFHKTPLEAIVYLEKSYRLNPEWHGPILALGRSYFKLGQYERALKYFQACEVFTGGSTDASSWYIGLINTILENKKKQGENR